MKKLYFLIITLVTALSLSGCTVNWFDRQYDVPWYYIFIVTAVIFVIAHIHVMSGTYICPSCKTEFKLKWYHFSAYIHVNDKRLTKCPKCGKKGFFKRK